MGAPLHTVILAAGAGSRMGHVPKCLIHADGKTLLERLLGALTPLQACETVLVVGHHGQAIERALAGWPLAQRVRCVTNPAPDESPAGSLRLALGALPSAALHPVMVVLADQPLLTARDLTAVWLAYQARAVNTEVLWPAVDGRPGHPVVMSPRVVKALRDNAVTSLKEWRLQHPDSVADWISDNPAHTFDLDTLADLQALRDATQLDWQLPQASDATPG